MKVPASQKISAYEFRKEGTKTIIELLDGAQGYSRKLDVLRRLANQKLKSERKFSNGLRELDEVGFVKITETVGKAKRIKLHKHMWDRNLDIIKLEHNLIGKRLKQSDRWLNPKTLVRYIRNTVEQKTTIKPSYYAVAVHLKIILNQHKHYENKRGLIRLEEFRVKEEKSLPQKHNYGSLFDFVPKEPEQISPLTEHETTDDSEIDFEQNEDIFNNNLPDNKYEENYGSVISVNYNSPPALTHLKSNHYCIIASRIMLPKAYDYKKRRVENEVINEFSNKKRIIGQSCSQISRS